MSEGKKEEGEGGEMLMRFNLPSFYSLSVTPAGRETAENIISVGKGDLARSGMREERERKFK